MACRLVKRYYLVQEEQDITAETQYFDWVGENNMFSGVWARLDMDWRVVQFNGKYGVIDIVKGEVVLDCIYYYVAVSNSNVYGPYLILKWMDEKNEKHKAYFSATKREMIS